jgi:hypothetical protein
VILPHTCPALPLPPRPRPSPGGHATIWLYYASTAGIAFNNCREQRFRSEPGPGTALNRVHIKIRGHIYQVWVGASIKQQRLSGPGPVGTMFQGLFRPSGLKNLPIVCRSGSSVPEPR